MALKPNQSKRGTQRGTSSNSVAKTGRDSMLKGNQPKRGNLHGSSSNSGDRSTRPVPKETQGSRGTRKASGGDGAGSVKGMPDIGPA
jgi:hypothetical protein